MVKYIFIQVPVHNNIPKENLKSNYIFNKIKLHPNIMLVIKINTVIQILDINLSFIIGLTLPFNTKTIIFTNLAMKKLLLLLIVPFLGYSQNFYDVNNDQIYNNTQVVGCVDLDETLLDLVSIFGDTSLLDIIRCAEPIPT